MYHQTLPLAWLKNPNEHERDSLLEFIRGAVYSLSASADASGREIHVLRIRDAFSRIGAPSLHRVGLKLLRLLGEAEPTFGGYWLLAPFRIVEIEKMPVLIGSVPLALGHFGSVECDGLCRILCTDHTQKFPYQTIEDWMGLPPSNPNLIVENFLHTHLSNALPTKSTNSPEFLNFGKAGDGRFTWTAQPSYVLDDRHIGICRQQYGHTYQYFSATIRSRRIITEANIEQPLPRLMFALANYANRRVAVRVTKQLGTCQIKVNERLPIEEFRLALLLSRKISRNGRSTTFQVGERLSPILLKYLNDLGCCLEITE